MPDIREQVKTRGVREVLSTVEEVRAGVVEIVKLANRGLSILTHDLEPQIYDHDDFLETLKKFIKPEVASNPTVFLSDADMKKMQAPDALSNDIRRTMTRLYTSFKTGL